jgi:hypothetical protein
MQNGTLSNYLSRGWYAAKDHESVTNPGDDPNSGVQSLVTCKWVCSVGRETVHQHQISDFLIRNKESNSETEI